MNQLLQVLYERWQPRVHSRYRFSYFSQTILLQELESSITVWQHQQQLALAMEWPPGGSTTWYELAAPDGLERLEVELCSLGVLI